MPMMDYLRLWLLHGLDLDLGLALDVGLDLGVDLGVGPSLGPSQPSVLVTILGPAELVQRLSPSMYAVVN